MAAEGEFIVAVPGEPDTIEQSARLVSIVLEGGLSLTLEIDGALAGNVMVHRRAGRHYAHVAEIAILVGNGTAGRDSVGMLMEMGIAWSRAVGAREAQPAGVPGQRRCHRALSIARVPRGGRGARGGADAGRGS